MPKELAEAIVIEMEGQQYNIRMKHLPVCTHWTPTQMDNYYQCYEEYDKDDTDNTIITSNLKKDKCENLVGIDRGFIAGKIKIVHKKSGG